MPATFPLCPNSMSSAPTYHKMGWKTTFPLAWKNLYMTGVLSPTPRIWECLESFVRQSNIKNTGLFLHWELSLIHWFCLIHETARSIIHGDIFDVWFYYFILSYNQNISYQSHTPLAFSGFRFMILLPQSEKGKHTHYPWRPYLDSGTSYCYHGKPKCNRHVHDTRHVASPFWNANSHLKTFKWTSNLRD